MLCLVRFIYMSSPVVGVRISLKQNAHMVKSLAASCSQINRQCYIGTAPNSTANMRCIIFLGTVRENRLGLRVAKFMEKMLKDRNYQTELWDPLELNLPMVTKPVHFYGPERKGAPAQLVELEQKIRQADAYVIVSAEYNHSIPPALANMLDHFPGSAFSYKPSGIVCYSPGIYGGMRAAMQIRAMLGEIGCISVSNIFGIPKVHESLDESGKPLNDHMEKGANTLLTQLDWMAEAMKTQRDTKGVPK